MIERLTRALIDAGLAPDAGQLADVLWLAAQLGGTRQRDGMGATPAAISDEPAAPPARADTSAAERRAQEPEPVTEGEGSRPLEGLSGSGTVAGTFADGVLHVPGIAATGMPPSVTQTLQAFSRRLPSRTESALDEEATAEQAVDTGVWMPVMVPERDYGFDLLLVAEDSETGPLWADAIAEFARMLSTQAAFRHVHRLSLLRSENGRLRDEQGNVGLLSNWRGNRIALVLLVSDTMSPMWRDGTMHVLLRRWRDVGPVALLQPMPRATWRRLPLGAPRLTLASHAPLRHNQQLQVEATAWLGQAPADAFAIPVLGFDEASLRRWAEVMTGRADATVPGIYLPAAPEARPAGHHVASGLRHIGGPERVALFRQTASPAAYVLAVHLSILDEMTIPLMRLVQRIMQPDGGAGELAEVFLGGLLERSPRTERAPADLAYRFMPDVRTALVTSRRRSDECRIDDCLGFIDEQLPQQDVALPVRSGDFGPPAPGSRLTDWVLPFSPVSRKLLRSHTMRHVGTPGHGAGAYGLEWELRLARSAMRAVALASTYALPDDEILDDIPLAVSTKASLWLVGLVRYVLLMGRDGGGTPYVKQAIPTEDVVLVDAETDGQGRGWLNFHWQNHSMEFDIDLWPQPFVLQLQVKNLYLLAQQAKTGRMSRAFQEVKAGIEHFRPDTVFWKLEAADKGESAPNHWNMPSLSAMEGGWLAQLDRSFLHAYHRPDDSRQFLHALARRVASVEPKLVAVPFHVPRLLSLVSVAGRDTNVIVNIANSLYPEDRRRAVKAIHDCIHRVQPSVNGIIWENAALDGELTHSFFVDTFAPHDLQYDDALPLDTGGGGAWDAGNAEEPDESQEPEQVDQAALAEWLTIAVEIDDVPGFQEMLKTALANAVDDADWDIDVSSPLTVEVVDARGILETWQFGGRRERGFEPVEYEDGTLTVTRQVRTIVRIVGTFKYSMWDSRDKRMVYLGTDRKANRVGVFLDAEFQFSGIAERKPVLEWIEIPHIARQISFGNVELDLSDDRDEDIG